MSASEVERLTDDEIKLTEDKSSKVERFCNMNGVYFFSVMIKYRPKYCRKRIYCLVLGAFYKFDLNIFAIFPLYPLFWLANKTRCHY